MIKFFHLLDNFNSEIKKKKTCNFSMSKIIDKNTGKCQKSRKTLELNFTTHECIRTPTTHSYFTVGRCKTRLRAQVKQLSPQDCCREERNTWIFSEGAHLGQDRHDLSTGKATIFFWWKPHKKILDHNWSIHTSYKNMSTFESCVIGINESGICFRKRMKHKCVTEDNNKLGTFISYQCSNLLKS